MLSWEADEEVVRLFGELAVSAFLHDTRVPWIIDAFLNGELNEEVQGVLPIFPQKVQSVFRCLRFLVDRRDGEGCGGRYRRDLIEITKCQKIVPSEETH